MAVGSYSEVVLPVKATAAITQNRGMTLAGAVPAAGAAGYLAVTGGAINDMVSVTVVGTAQAEAGAAFAADVVLEFDAQARLITRTTGVAVARSVTASSGAGAVVEALVIPH